MCKTFFEHVKHVSNMVRTFFEQHISNRFQTFFQNVVKTFFENVQMFKTFFGWHFSKMLSKHFSKVFKCSKHISAKHVSGEVTFFESTKKQGEKIWCLTMYTCWRWVYQSRRNALRRKDLKCSSSTFHTDRSTPALICRSSAPVEKFTPFSGNRSTPMT